MTGVEILSEYEVCATQEWVGFVAALAYIGAIIFIVGACMSKQVAAIWAHVVCFIVCVLVLFCDAAISCSDDYFKKYSHMEYEVIVDDSVSMNEFLDKYEIIDQEGKIYTVKERYK